MQIRLSLPNLLKVLTATAAVHHLKWQTLGTIHPRDQLGYIVPKTTVFGALLCRRYPTAHRIPHTVPKTVKIVCKPRLRLRQESNSLQQI